MKKVYNDLIIINLYKYNFKKTFAPLLAASLWVKTLAISWVGLFRGKKILIIALTSS